MSDKHKTIQYQLRMPADLRERIRDSAESNDRSMNAEIIARLQETFQFTDDAVGIFTQDEIKALAIEVAKVLSDNRDLSQEFIQIINSPNKKPTA